MNAMRFAETSPTNDRPAPRSALPGRRFASFLLALVAAAISFTPMTVRADTPPALPQGWTSDEPQVAATADTDDFQPTQAVDADVDVDVTVAGDEYIDTDPAALNDFREPLSPYGTWVEDSTYGTVWVPSSSVVGADFAPYQTSGHWELDVDGDWMWVSDYDWGYIPFHYGRWTWIGGRGWGWIPGRVYAPAWVTWRMTDYGYVGWAPMAPSWYWFGGSAVNVWVSPPAAYVFCPSSYVFHRHVHTYVVRDRDIVRRIGAHSRPYRAAQPTAHTGASAARAHRPASPSLAEAKIPPSAAPQKRSAPDTRAAAYSRRSTTAKWKSMSPEARAMAASPSARSTHAAPEARTVHPRSSRSGRVDVSPSRPSVAPSRRSVSPSRRSVSPSRPSVSPSRPSVSPSRSSRPSVSPSRSSRPSVSPSRSSRPSVSPSRSSRPSASPSRSPSRSFHSPSRSSSPSRSFHSPSRSSGSRGRR